MDRRQFYKDQTVGEDDLNGEQDSIETADNHVLDACSLGAFPLRGLAPSADGISMNLGVSSGVGLGTDSFGNPIYVKLVANSTILLSSAVPTSLPKPVLVCLQFTRDEYQPVIDGDNAQVMYRQDESSALLLVQGTEGGSKPSIPVDCVPLCDLLLRVGQTFIVAADLDLSRCRPSYGKMGSTGSVAAQVGDLAELSLDNCCVRPIEPASSEANTVQISAGRFNLNGKQVLYAGGTTGFAAGAPSSTWIGLVYLDETGTVKQLLGTVVALPNVPVAPSHVGCSLPLAEVTVTTDSSGNVLPILASAIKDVRPFLRGDYLTWNEARIDMTVDASASIQSVTLPFPYVPGSHSLWVWWEQLDTSGNSTAIVSLGPQAYVSGTTLGYYEEDPSGTLIKVYGPTLNGLRVDKVIVRAAVPGDLVAVQPHAASHAVGGSDAFTHAAQHAADGGDPIDYSAMNGVVFPGLYVYASGTNDVAVAPFSLVIGGRLRIGNAMSVTIADNQYSSAWVYLYAYFDSPSSAVKLEVSSVAPDGYRRFKSGDSSRVYLAPIALAQGGSFRPKAFVRTDRTTTYQVDATKTEDNISAQGVNDFCIAAISTQNALATPTMPDRWIPGHGSYNSYTKTMRIGFTAYAESTIGVCNVSVGGRSFNVYGFGVVNTDADGAYSETTMVGEAFTLQNSNAADGWCVIRAYIAGFTD